MLQVNKAKSSVIGINCSLLKIPSEIANRIEKLIRDFFLEGFDKLNGSHFIRRDVVLKFKFKRRLGTENVEKKNTALLIK